MGVALFAVLGVLRGWIVPEPVMKRIISTYEERLQDRDDELERLREINSIQDKRHDMLLEQVRLMVDANRTSNAALLALPTILGVADGTHSPTVPSPAPDATMAVS